MSGTYTAEIGCGPDDETNQFKKSVNQLSADIIHNKVESNKSKNDGTIEKEEDEKE